MGTLTSSGAVWNIEVVNGAAFARTFYHKINGVVTDITNYSFNAQIRTNAGTLAATMTATTVNAGAGTFSLSLTGAQTSGLVAGGLYRWSLEQTVGGVTTELLRGLVNVVDEITV